MPYFSGSISEILFYHTSLSDSLRNIVDHYLLNKYAPPLNLGPDIYRTYSYCPVTLVPNAHFRHYLWSTGDTTATVTVDSPGLYHCLVEDFFGRTHRDTVYVFNTFSAPQLTDTTICHYDSATFISNVTGSYTFQWNDDPLLTGSTFMTGAAGPQWLQVTDTLGCSLSDTAMVTVNYFPDDASLGPDRRVCQYDHLTLQQGAAGAVSYLWSTAPADTLSYVVVHSPGTYTVTVTDTLGCVAVDSVDLLLKAIAPTAHFTTNATALCRYDTLLITDSSFTLDPYDVISQWSFTVEDTTYGHSGPHHHTFAAPGSYVVALSVTTDSGCVHETTLPVTVHPIPNVTFSPHTACEDNPVLFTRNDTTLTISDYLWYFNDPYSSHDTSTAPQPSYVYTQPGSYPVMLTLTTTEGCTNLDSAMVTVREGPKAGFYHLPPDACFGDDIYFVDTSLASAAHPVTGYLWDFGDNTTLSGSNSPVHYYTQPGTYPVVLTVTAATTGCYDTAVTYLTVHHNPVVAFSDTIYCVNDSITFTSQAAVASDTIATWYWEIPGTGTWHTRQITTLFPDSGAYGITHAATTPFGCSDTLKKSITVYPAPQAAFSFDPYYGAPPVTVQFFNATTGATNYLWDFGDGNTATMTNPSHLYSTTGVYAVTLQAANSYQCKSTATEYFYALMPEIDIEMISLTTHQHDDMIQPEVVFRNNSDYIINAVHLLAFLNGGNPVIETWEAASTADRMKPGDYKSYTFVSRFSLDPALNKNTDYLCVQSQVPGFPEDSNPENDQRCKVINSSFKVFDPYPNPATTGTTLDFIADYAGQATITLLDISGQDLGTLYDTYVEKGLNRLIISLPPLAGGIYIINLSYRDITINKKLTIID